MFTVRDERVLSGVQRVEHAALGALWLVVVVSFWRWWLAPAHRGQQTSREIIFVQYLVSVATANSIH